MKKTILFLTGVCVLMTANAAHVATDWVQRYDGPGNNTDQAHAMTVDGDGNVYVTGNSVGTNSLSDYATIAYSSDGVPLWTNRYGGLGTGSHYATAIAPGNSNDVYVTGYSSNGTNYDYATIAYSSAGVPLWTNRYNGPGDNNDAPKAVTVDGSGNVYVTGTSVGTNGNFDYLTVAYSSAGLPLWSNRYNGPADSRDEAAAVAVDSNGNVYVTGSSIAENGKSDYLTVAYSSTGSPLWTSRYNGTMNSNDWAYAIAVDSGNNVYVTGSSHGSLTAMDYVTIKYSSAGSPLWTNRYTGPGYSVDAAAAITVDGNGNVHVTGELSVSDLPDYATIAYSGAGVPLWAKRYNGPGNSYDEATAMAVDSSGTVYVTGMSDGGGSGIDIATLAYSSAGSLLWTARYTGQWPDVDDMPKAIAVSPDGGVVVAGYSANDTNGSFDFVVFKLAPVAITTLTNGNGFVTPSLTSSNLVPNKKYKLSATPSAGYIFSNWLAVVDGVTNEVSDSRTFSFTNIDNQSTIYIAQFVPNRFLAAAGTYYGLFSDETNGVDLKSAGFFKLTVKTKPSALPTFSLNVSLDGEKLSGAGTFDLEGEGELKQEITRKSGQAALTIERLTLDLDNRKVTGELTTIDHQWYAALSADQDMWTTNGLATNYDGSYTLVVPGAIDDASTNAPGGDGYGIVTIDTNGAIKLSGALGDGESFKQSGLKLSKDGQWPLYAMMNNDTGMGVKKGMIMGWVTVDGKGPGPNDLSGTLNWFRGAGGAGLYPAGFTNYGVVLEASKYDEPDAGGRAIQLDTNGVGQLTLAHEAGLTNSIVVTNIGLSPMPTNKWTTPANPDSVKMTTSANKTGVVGGTFKNAGQVPPLQFKGVILQDANEARGYFKNPATGQSGSFLLEAQQP